MIAGRRTHLRNAAAHLAGADDADAVDVLKSQAVPFAMRKAVLSLRSPFHHDRHRFSAPDTETGQSPCRALGF